MKKLNVEVGLSERYSTNLCVLSRWFRSSVMVAEVVAGVGSNLSNGAEFIQL